jgi:diacylglycerol O-acyltransferase / wax synthase
MCATSGGAARWSWSSMPDPHVEALDRLSPDDAMSLVGSSSVPLQVGALLVLDAGGLDEAVVRAALARRLSAVPRLRRRLVNVPVGCGRPFWCDQADFSLVHHLAVHPTVAPLSRADLLDLAAELVTTPLAMTRPLWRVTVVPAVEGGRGALVIVFHHVLADGVAGLTLVGALLGDTPAPEDPDFPRPVPTRVRLVHDAFLERLRALRRLPEATARLVGGFAALAPALGEMAEPCSFNRPTGPDRYFRTVGADLGQLLGYGHEHGATLNDVVLTVAVGAVDRLLAERGEHVESLVVSVPFSARRTTDAHHLGNGSGVVPLRLPTLGSFPDRLARTAVLTAAAKRRPRGASTAVLAPVFRLLDRLGVYRRFIDHQRVIHTFVSTLRGPAESLLAFGRSVTEVVPLSVATGNVTASFTAISYLDRLLITINADPLTCPDVDRLRDALEDQLRGLQPGLS